MNYLFSKKTRLIGLFVAIIIILIIGQRVFAYTSVYVDITSAGVITAFNPDPYTETNWGAGWGIFYNSDCTSSAGASASGGGASYFSAFFHQTTGNDSMEGIIWPVQDGTFYLCFGVATFEYKVETYRSGGSWTTLASAPEIIGVSPVSGTEITDLESNLTIEYHNLDWDIYDGFIVNFRDNKLGIVGESAQFLKADLDPSGTGSEVISLSDFQIANNGLWNLTALGFGTELDIEGGMFLTTRGAVDFWSDELVLTPYNLIFNVEGLPSPYTFTTPESWYVSNVERFASPTEFFVGFVDLLTPIFEKVGDFGIRTQTMFNQNEAYERGFALGEIFPLINSYIKKIDQFFGGFPLASFFKYVILVMLAIFIFRAVMKFIPFFG